MMRAGASRGVGVRCEEGRFDLRDAEWDGEEWSSAAEIVSVCPSKLSYTLPLLQPANPRMISPSRIEKILLLNQYPF